MLIVDDETELVDVLKARLEANNYEVVTAGDGQEGLEKAKSENPDLIVLDLMLPKLDGYKVCRLLKFDDKYKKIPIILFSARVQDSDKEMGKSVGADDYVTKPFDSKDLLQRIKKLLNN
ncbi:MAG: response regulator [bacterium]|nr:response regulator [bacterium]